MDLTPSREPVMVGAVVAGLLQVLLAHRVLDEVQAEAWKPLLTLIASVGIGWIVRHFTMPTSTVRKAGHDPETLVAKAKGGKP